MSSVLRRLSQITLLSFVSVYALGQDSAHNQASHSTDDLRVQLAQLPLAFEQNTGQAAAGTHFLAHSGMMQAEISRTRIQLSLPSRGGQQEKVSISLQGAQQDTKPSAAERLPGESNYLIGKDPSAWHLHVPQYRQIGYPEVYRGIDLAYYGSNGRLEHDFVVHPGADPSQIHLGLDGARSVRVENDGDLRIALASGAVILRRPRVYQTLDGAQRDVPSRFVLQGKRVGFELGEYDHKQTLVIDPVLDYSTFLGNASITVTAVAVDAAGDTYIAGEAPVAYPATADAATCSSCVTPANKLAVFVTELNPTATAVIYSTFIGGSTSPLGSASTDQSNAITVDANGDAIVTGTTSSTDFPLKNPISAGTPSGEDGFLVSLTPDGSGLNFSSRLGGTSSPASAGFVYPESLATDSNGNVYAAGLSESPYLPVTPGALDAITPSYNNTGAFLLKLSTAGSLVYGAVVGAVGTASGSTGPTGLAVDSTGVVYMAGTAGETTFTTTTPWPTTSGAYQTTLVNSGQNAPFVTRISADGSTILSSTLVGSGSVTAMTLTPSNDVLIAGMAGYNFPVTSDAYSSNVSTSTNGTITFGAPGFFTKVSQDGTQLLYSSVFGSSGSSISINGIQLDPSGKVWIAGTTVGPLPILVHPLQSVYAGYGDQGFIAEFDAPMHNLLFSSYVNGMTGNSQVNGLAIDPNGLAHVAGVASQTFPTSPGVVVPTVQPPPPNYFYTYGYAALIDATKQGGSVCFANPRSATVQVGTTGSGSFDIVNCGDGPLTISSTQLTSSVFAFASTNTCTGTLAAGSTCTLNYTFAPSAMGSASATVTLATNAPMAANAETILGTGTAPVVYLFTNSITFDPVVLGTTGQPATVLVMNRGTAALIVNTSQTNATSPFSIAGTTCNSSVSPSGSCTFSISFNPTAAGSATGNFTLYTNDPVTPSVTVSLSASSVASYPVPTITSLSPPTLSLDGGPSNLLIYGTNFFPATTVQINGIAYAVKSEGNTAIEVSVDPSTIGAVGEFPVQVFNPSPGGASNTATLTTYHVLSLTATNMVYEPHAGLLYAATPAISSTNPNSVLSINPATGAFGTAIAVQANPTKLAVSDDGQYLYVAFFGPAGSTSNSVQRVNLTTGAVDRTFALPGSSSAVIDMHVVPGAPQLLVASLSRNASPVENGVALFNDSGLVQYINDNPGGNEYSLDNFTFTSDPTTYYGYPATNSFFNTATVSSSGITPVSFSPYGECCNQSSGSIMVSDGTLLYTNSGEVWDPKAKTLLGTYPGSLFYEPAIVADATAKRTFILQTGFPTGPSTVEEYPTVASYNPSNYTQAGMIYFPLSNDSPTSLARWGADGFAFLNNETYPTTNTPVYTSQLVLFRSSLATPGAASPVTLSPASLNFALQPVSVASAGQPITVSNTGSATLTGLSVNITGTNASSFSASSACGTSLAPGASCTINVVFTPSATGNAQATLQIIDSAIDSPQNVELTGDAVAPSFTVSSQSLTFSSLPDGSSTQQTVTLTNSGTVVLSGIMAAVSGANAADFTATSTCGASVAPGATCTMTTTFKPSTTGNETATLTVSASGTASQVIAMSGSGTAPNFALSPSTGSSSVTVPAGQPASFSLSMSESGTFSGTIAMSCSNLPAYAACTFTPSSLTLASTPTTVTLSISTEQTVQAELRQGIQGRNAPLRSIQWAMLLLALPAASRRLRRRLARGRILMSVLVICACTLALNGCGGGSAGGSTGPTVEKTPTGSYSVAVTATSGSVSHTANVTLVVQ